MESIESIADKPKSSEDGWKIISVSRSIASFWFNFIILLVAAVKR